MLFWILLLAVIVWFAVRGLPGWSSQAGASSAGRETPRQVLERRYAAGDITTEEYEERKARLQDRRS